MATQAYDAVIATITVANDATSVTKNMVKSTEWREGTSGAWLSTGCTLTAGNVYQFRTPLSGMSTATTAILPNIKAAVTVDWDTSATPITTVGDDFMYYYANGCSGLTSLGVPDTSGLTSVGSGFMSNYAGSCIALASLILPPTTGWFANNNVGWNVPAGRLGILQAHVPDAASKAAWDLLTVSGKTLYTNYIQSPDNVIIDGGEPEPEEYTLEAAKGTYTLSGANVNLTVQRNYKLEASAGSYSLTGKDVSISVKRNYTLTANAGIYSVSGKNADLILQRNYTLEAEQGNYALTGADVSFSVKRNYVLALEGGTYNLTGHNVDLSTSISTTYVLNCEAGSYVLTGNPLTINKSLILTLGNGAYSVLGHDVKLLFERVLSLGVGSYALSGKDLGFVKSLILSIDTGDYVLTGMDAYFIAGETTTPACRTYVVEPENRTYKIKC